VFMFFRVAAMDDRRQLLVIPCEDNVWVVVQSREG
jgi:hypothetical protein